MDEFVDVTITAPDVDWLAAFTRQLVEDGLAASGNIVPTVRSNYRWRGQVEDATEALVVLHTRLAHVETIIERTTAEDPYETPHVLAHPVTEAKSTYRNWIKSSTSRPPG